MFDISISGDYGVLWHRICLFIISVYQNLIMFLGRSESIKWIRRKFSKRNSSCSSTSSNIEHTPAKVLKSSNARNENIRDLNEILIVNDNSATILPAILNSSRNLATIHNNENDEVMSTTIQTNHQTAPIAREEDAEEDIVEESFEKQNGKENKSNDVGNDAKEYNQEQQQQQHQHCQVINENVLRCGSQTNTIAVANAGNSKSSRVRNYLKKCKDRWLAVGLHNQQQMQEYSASSSYNDNTGHDPKSTMSAINELDVSQHLGRTIKATTMETATTIAKVTVNAINRSSSMGGGDGAAVDDDDQGRSCDSSYADDSVNKKGSCAINCALGNLKAIKENENYVDDFDDDDVDDSYEDIDFGLSSVLAKAIAKNSHNSAQFETRPGRKDFMSMAQQQKLHDNNVGIDKADNDGDEDEDEDDDQYKNNVEQLVHGTTIAQMRSMQESHIAALIDSHLACIYPVFTSVTRAVLIREARDVLVKSYHGCLTAFERQFLCKFKEIAVILKERHRIGEALIWCQGWPLVTPTGEVILHLGSLDDVQVKTAEIYLCIKTTATNQIPQLYAIWRTPTKHYPLFNTNTVARTKTTSSKSGSTLKSCQLDYQDHTLYLSPLALEMLSDDLPQLLQNLLIGVENSLERLSFNQLPQIPFSDDSSFATLTTATASSTAACSSTVSKAETLQHHYATLNGRSSLSTHLPNSPKCALRRSELITKNKLHNNKYMLRRLTIRQDSINSTSSGNSSASGLSTASSDSDSYAKTQLNFSSHNNKNNLNSSSNSNNNNNNTNGHKILTATTATTASSSATIQNETKTSQLNSPALPRFCLGNSFPHIDSDEENADDKRNSLTDDQLESEIIPPNLITDLSEKLLLSGIYLPGTRDLKGNPLVTVDAESVVTAGLNCYEIATLLLYYSTIPECSLQSSNHLNGKTISTNTAQRSQPAQPQPVSNQLTTSQYATAIANTQSSSSPSSSSSMQKTTTVTTSTIATCTTLNDDNDDDNNNNNNNNNQNTSNNINVNQKIDQPEPDQLQQHQQQQEQQQHVQQKRTFTILIAIEKSQHLCVIDLISQSLKLLTRHMAYSELLAICLDTNLLPPAANQISNTEVIAANNATDSNANHCNNSHNKKSATYTIKFISVDEVTTSVAPSQTPSGRLGGLHHHDARKWRDFFMQYEPFYNQCTGAAQRLVAALNDIRYADLQGLPTRRQLYAQHRALSRALMDSELHNLRKRSTPTMLRLQELAKAINHNGSSSYGISMSYKTTANAICGNTSIYNRNKIMGSSVNGSGSAGDNGSSSCYSFNYQSNQIHSQISHNISTLTKSPASTALVPTTKQATNDTSTTTTSIIKSSSYASKIPTASPSTTATTIASRVTLKSGYNNNNVSATSTTTVGNIDVAIRLQRVTLLFNEIDRAAKRLEQLTEQRREHLRELTRQRALEDEINEVTSWITSDGSESLQRFLNLELDFDTPMKELEHEFEKYYFISMKHLAKGRDLYLAANCMDSLKESSINLKKALDTFAEKLEIARERIEAATRLYHLINRNMLEENMQNEMERLASQYGVKGLLEKYIEKEAERLKTKPDSLSLNINQNSLQKTLSQMVTSTPETNKLRSISQRSSAYGTASFESPRCQCWRDSRNLEDMDEMLDNDEEEGRSKIADSGVGECQRCEGNPKFTRVCSCQSLNEETENLYEKNDQLDDECFEQPSKHYVNMHSPWEANKHLQCFASTFELPKLEELSCLDPKIQKTLLLIMREMIGTERDYVRSLYYVIENYIDELLRDDIPQSLRGQRNVIFGNIEKIFEFHNNHFLAELERYEHNPLKVGAAFLQMESQFYLYALYNKNKPKSDTLMSEYGTAFFKSKQIELNDKMDLASYLLKPVQRMGKYALLLQQLVKACNAVQGKALQEIAADVEELQKAEKMVKFQLRHGNDLLAMDSLRDCDVNVKEQGRLLRQNEFLVWQGKGGKKTLRQIFLFEELVLFSKARRFPDHKNLDIYIYKNSIKTSDIGLTAHVGDSPTKFEIWFRKRKPEDTFTLQCMSEDIKNAWTEEISKLLWQQAKRNREIRLAEMSSMGIGSKPCLDIRPSNNQINDRSITISQLGKAPKLRHSFVGLSSTDNNKTSRRPNSLISESSLSSGTSSSSLCKSSTSSSSTSSAHQHHHDHKHNHSHPNQQHNHNNNHHYHHHQHQQHQHPIQSLELINECQTLALDNGNNTDSCNRSQQQFMTNTLSSGFSSQSGSGSSGSGGSISSRHRHQHKRSTTIVSQLSMESGIISDLCMTPDQDNNDVLTAWPSSCSSFHSTDAIVSPTTVGGQKYPNKCHSSKTLGKKMEQHHHHQQHHRNHHHSHHQQQCKELKSEATEGENKSSS